MPAQDLEKREPTTALPGADRDRSSMGLRVLVPALATAAQLAPPNCKGRALSVTIGGISVAWVVGVPAGAVIVDYLGWRVSFALAAPC